MKATDKIKNLIHTLNKADGFNACIIEGAPGWGKTTAVADALVRLKIEYAHLGTWREGCGGLWEQAPHQGIDSEGILAHVRNLLG